MRFLFKTRYDQDIVLAKHGGHRFWYGLLMLALVTAPWWLESYGLAQLTFILIYGIVGLGLMLLAGFTGLFSIGHGAFLGVGAYTQAVLAAQGWPFPASLAMAGVLSAGALWSTIAFLFIHHFVVTAVVVEGKSMEPTLLPGERCIVNCWIPYFREYRRGDLVVIRDPMRQERLIKRIIGLPNDRLRFVDGKVYVNGTHLEEGYISRNNYTYSRQIRSQIIQVAEGSYFVMGDNRIMSEDSRAFGDVERADILGLVWR